MTRSERSLDPYTVGKHTLVAIGHLDEIRRTEPSSPLGGAGFGSPISPTPTSELEDLNTAFRSLSDAAPLFMALFLHDIDNQIQTIRRPVQKKQSASHPNLGSMHNRRMIFAFSFENT